MLDAAPTSAAAADNKGTRTRFTMDAAAAAVEDCSKSVATPAAVVSFDNHCGMVITMHLL